MLIRGFPACALLTADSHQDLRSDTYEVGIPVEQTLTGSSVDRRQPRPKAQFVASGRIVGLCAERQNSLYSGVRRVTMRGGREYGW